MAGFWCPYSGFPEAARKLDHYADSTVGHACGITYSDGVNISVVRRPSGGSGRGQWLNFLRRHVSARPSHRPQAPSRLQQFETAVGHFFQWIGEGEMRRAEAERAQSEAMLKVVHDYVWRPAHEFLLRHKLVADGVASHLT